MVPTLWNIIPLEIRLVPNSAGSNPTVVLAMDVVEPVKWLHGLLLMDADYFGYEFYLVFIWVLLLLNCCIAFVFKSLLAAQNHIFERGAV